MAAGARSTREDQTSRFSKLREKDRKLEIRFGLLAWERS